MKTQLTATHPRILIIDENPGIHDDFLEILGYGQMGQPVAGAMNPLLSDAPDTASRKTFRVDCALQGQDALMMVEKAQTAGDSYAVAFIDVRSQHGWDAMETLARIWEREPDLQAVLCTTHFDCSRREIIKRFGFSDNLLILKKPFEIMEVLQIAHTLTQKWQLEREARLKRDGLALFVPESAEPQSSQGKVNGRGQPVSDFAEEVFSKAFEFCPLPVAVLRWPAGPFLTANANFLELTGCASDEILACDIQELGIWQDSSVFQEVQDKQGSLCRHACVIRRRDGALRNVLLWSEPIRIHGQRCLVLALQDVTENRMSEARMEHLRKLEVVDRLVASVTHEVNNVHTVIQGHAAFLNAELAQTGKLRHSAEQILNASQRVALFMNQLLIFRGKGARDSKLVNPETSFGRACQLFGSSLGEQHELKIGMSDHLPCILASDGSVEQIVMNLLSNARDAMPKGGVISVSACVENVSTSAGECHPDANSGEYICLTVSDAGCGMSREMLDSIFDPFFTTKEVGSGLGLGLSTVYSLILQLGGWIEVASQVGLGSTFKVFLPIWEGMQIPDGIATVEHRAIERKDNEVILLVEDEEMVRELARITLEGEGYHVVAAEDGIQALKVWETRPAGFDLLVTDLVMPNDVGGAELTRRLRQHDASLKVICASGYAPEFDKEELSSQTGVMFLPKPYLPSQLLQSVRECLDKPCNEFAETGEPLARLASA